MQQSTLAIRQTQIIFHSPSYSIFSSHLRDMQIYGKKQTILHPKRFHHLMLKYIKHNYKFIYLFWKNKVMSKQYYVILQSANFALTKASLKEWIDLVALRIRVVNNSSLCAILKIAYFLCICTFPFLKKLIYHDHAPKVW